MTAGAMYQKLLKLETNGKLARDFREVISKERQVLHVRMERNDARGIAAQVRECARVLESWKGYY